MIRCKRKDTYSHDKREKWTIIDVVKKGRTVALLWISFEILCITYRLSAQEEQQGYEVV